MAEIWQREREEGGWRSSLGKWETSAEKDHEPVQQICLGPASSRRPHRSRATGLWPEGEGHLPHKAVCGTAWSQRPQHAGERVPLTRLGMVPTAGDQANPWLEATECNAP